MIRSLFLALAMAAGAALSAGAATASEPTGVWEPDNRESRYALTYCGEGARYLCAELIWIQEDKQDARNTRYLNTYIFEEARQVAPGRWRATVRLDGFNIGGTLTQTSANVMELRACAVFVFCEEIRLNRVAN